MLGHQFAAAHGTHQPGVVAGGWGLLPAVLRGTLRSTIIIGPYHCGPVIIVPINRIMPPKTTSPKRNPFEIGLRASGTHFADREAETARIVRAFSEPGSKLVVYGDRRLGKSSAMDRAAEEVRKAGTPVALASLATARDSADAAQRVLAAVHAAVGAGWREAAQQIASSLNATLEIKPSTDPGALPSVAFGFGARGREAEHRLLPDALDAINTLLERRGMAIGVGLDEFQRIHEWGGEDAEWALKDVFERHRHVGYVLAGSKRHQIEAMVSRKGRALWKQVDLLAFGPIDPDELAAWIAAHAGRAGVRIPLTEADAVVRYAGPRTRDIVQLARALWDDSARATEAAAGGAAASMERLVREQGAFYEAMWRGLATAQAKVMRALAADPGLQITSAEAARRYGLGPKSTVSSALDALVESEFLVRTEQGYAFDDPFFQRWVQVYVLPDLGLAAPPLG